MTDRIELRYRADGEVATALAEHGTVVADEVLAAGFAPGEPEWPAPAHTDTGLGLTFWLRRAS